MLDCIAAKQTSHYCIRKVITIQPLDVGHSRMSGSSQIVRMPNVQASFVISTASCFTEANPSDRRVNVFDALAVLDIGFKATSEVLGADAVRVVAISNQSQFLTEE